MAMPDYEPAESSLLALSTVIVNYIPDELTEGALAHLFSRFRPSHVKLVTDKLSGHPLGYGFVEFARRDDAEAAINDLNGIQIFNKRLKVTMARPRDEVPLNTNVYLAGMPVTWSEWMLRTLGASLGDIVEMRLLPKQPGHQTLSGFIRYHRRAESDMAIALLDGFPVSAEGLVLRPDPSDPDVLSKKAMAAMMPGVFLLSAKYAADSRSRSKATKAALAAQGIMAAGMMWPPGAAGGGGHMGGPGGHSHMGGGGGHMGGGGGGLSGMPGGVLRFGSMPAAERVAAPMPPYMGGGGGAAGVYMLGGGGGSHGHGAGGAAGGYGGRMGAFGDPSYGPAGSMAGLYGGADAGMAAAPQGYAGGGGGFYGVGGPAASGHPGGLGGGAPARSHFVPHSGYAAFSGAGVMGPASAAAAAAYGMGMPAPGGMLHGVGGYAGGGGGGGGGGHGAYDAELLARGFAAARGASAPDHGAPAPGGGGGFGGGFPGFGARAGPTGPSGGPSGGVYGGVGEVPHKGPTHAAASTPTGASGHGPHLQPQPQHAMYARYGSSGSGSGTGGVTPSGSHGGFVAEHGGHGGFGGGGRTPGAGGFSGGPGGGYGGATPGHMGAQPHGSAATAGGGGGFDAARARGGAEEGYAAAAAADALAFQQHLQQQQQAMHMQAQAAMQAQGAWASVGAREWVPPPPAAETAAAASPHASHVPASLPAAYDAHAKVRAPPLPGPAPVDATSSGGGGGSHLPLEGPIFALHGFGDGTHGSGGGSCGSSAASPVSAASGASPAAGSAASSTTRSVGASAHLVGEHEHEGALENAIGLAPQQQQQQHGFFAHHPHAHAHFPQQQLPQYGHPSDASARSPLTTAALSVLSAGDRRSQGSIGTRHSAAAELSYHDGRSVLSGGGSGSPDAGADVAVEGGASPVGASPPLQHMPLRAGSSGSAAGAPQRPVIPSLQYPSRLAQQSADAAVDAAASAGPGPGLPLPSAASEDLSTLLSSRLSQALGLSPRPAHATPLAGGSSSETLSGAASAPAAAGHGDAFSLVTSPRDVGALAAPARDPHAGGAAAGAPAFPPFQFSGGGGSGGGVPMGGAALRGKSGAEGAAAALGSGHEEQDDPSNAAEHQHQQQHGMGAHLGGSHAAAGKAGTGAATDLSGDADTVTADGRTALSGASTLGAGSMWPGHGAAIGSGGPLMGTAGGAAFSGAR